MKNRTINTDINLGSGEWMESDGYGAAGPFMSAGFSSTGQVLELRVYDMLNIMGIDRIMAEEMMYALYNFFNEDGEADEGLYYGFIDQYFDYTDWRMKHPDASKVLVKDIILAEGMNRDALAVLFDRVVRKFWRSGEYNSREYRYSGYSDLAEQRNKEGEK